MTTANLTIQDNDTVVQYTSVGEDEFTGTFPVLSEDEVAVSVDQVDMVLGVDYNVTGVGDAAGFTVDFTPRGGTTAGERVTIWQEMPLERLTGLSAGSSALLPEALNSEFVRCLRGLQQLRRDIRRAVRIPVDDPDNGQDMELPNLDTRKGKFFAFDAIYGEPYAAAGTGVDEGLRTDLAGGSASLVHSAAVFYITRGKETAAGVTVVDYSVPPYDVAGVALPERYGMNYDFSDEYTALEAACKVAEQAQCPVGLRGAAYFGTDLVVRRNVGFVGLGNNYGAQLVPTGSARIKIQGALVTGGYAFRNLFKDVTIDCSQTSAANAVDIDTAYNICFDHVTWSGFGTVAGNVRAMKVVNCNNLVMINPVARGVSPTFAGQYGFELGSGTLATIYSPDVESCNRAFYFVGTCKADLHGGYFERYSAWALYFALTAGGFVNVFGGQYLNVNGGAGVAYVPAGNANINFHALQISRNGGLGIYSDAPRLANVNVYGYAVGDVTDTHNAMRKNGGTNLTTRWRDRFENQKTQTDAAATTHYTLTLASASNMLLDLEVWATLGGGYAKVIQRRQILVTCPAGTAERGSINVVGTDENSSSSANYGITLTVSTVLSTNTCAIQITADTTGALGNGQTCDVCTELRVRSSSNSSYVDTA